MFVRGEENAEIYVKKVRRDGAASSPRTPTHPASCPPCVWPRARRGPESLHVPPLHRRQGAEGVVFCRCNTCIIVGYHNDKIQPGSCQMTVGKLADFLKESGI